MKTTVKQLLVMTGTLMISLGTGISGGQALAEEAQWPFTAEDHCVAYRTIKGVFFFFDAEVLGKNCAIEAELNVTDAGEAKQLVLSIPVNGFDSGNSGRDEHVAEILGGKELNSLRFLSAPLSPADIMALIAGEMDALSGTLVLNNQEHQVLFQVDVIQQGESPLINVKLTKTFKELNITVPSVAGGMIAAPGETLELLGQFHLNRIMGVETVSQINAEP